MNDKEIIDGILNGNESAFENLFKSYQKKVLNTCLSFTHDRGYAEDLTQEVFIEVLKSIKYFRSQSSLSTWIYRISVNKSINFVKKNNRLKFFENIGLFISNDSNYENIEQEHTDIQSEIDEEEKIKIVFNAISTLPKNQKIAFTLSKYDNLSNKEIADVMNLGIKAVESLIHRAKISLRKKLEKYFD